MFILCGLVLALLVAVFLFVYNPLGLGPEPDTVLSSAFFATPAEDLSELELLVEGEEAFKEVLAAVDSAKSSIFVQTYIWKDDNIGMRMVNRLKAAADRDVKVTVSKDFLGTFFELGDMLKGKPSPVYTSAGLKGYDNIEVNTAVFADTDHSKYFVVDEHIVIFGGMNIADEYHTKWHDYMVMIRSERWAEAFMKKVLDGSAWPSPSPFVVTINDRHATEIRTALIEMIENAKEVIIVEHAYFSDDQVIGAVKRAAARGVKVDIILPKAPNQHIYANRVTINKLLDGPPTRVPRVFLYPRMSHAKVVLSDGAIAAVGSANLTPRSMVTSREVTVFAHGQSDDRFIRELRDQLKTDLAQSEPVVERFELSLTDRIMAVAAKYTW